MKISHSEMHANLEDRLHEQNEALKAKTLALEDQRQQHLVEIDLLKRHHAARLDSSAARYERSAAEFQHALDTLHSWRRTLPRQARLGLITGQWSYNLRLLRRQRLKIACVSSRSI